jgi:hypothetical protein
MGPRSIIVRYTLPNGHPFTVPNVCRGILENNVPTSRLGGHQCALYKLLHLGFLLLGHPL